MTIEHVYADWDAAYVLGALSSTERREYEQHLVDCVSCQRALSEVAAMPGLLSKVDRGYAEKMELEDPPVLAKPATSCPVQALWPRLQARWRRQSAVRRLGYVGACRGGRGRCADCFVGAATVVSPARTDECGGGLAARRGVDASGHALAVERAGRTGAGRHRHSH